MRVPRCWEWYFDLHCMLCTLLQNVIFGSCAVLSTSDFLALSSTARR